MIKTGADVINDFRGDNEFLSNLYPSILIVDGEAYSTVEHAFQAAKTNDPVLKAQIRDAASAREAKKLGRNVTLIHDWDNIKMDVMASLIKQKFNEHLDLKLRLLLTGNKELIQGNTWKDRFWGQDQNGVGDNHLGKILTSVRTALHAAEGGSFQVLIKFLQDRKMQSISYKLETLLKLAEQVTLFTDPLNPPDFNLIEINDLLVSLK